MEREEERERVKERDMIERERRIGSSSGEKKREWRAEKEEEEHTKERVEK